MTQDEQRQAAAEMVLVYMDVTKRITCLEHELQGRGTDLTILGNGLANFPSTVHLEGDAFAIGQDKEGMKSKITLDIEATKRELSEYNDLLSKAKELGRNLVELGYTHMVKKRDRP